jgi:dTDP-glucose 4,6-dehydratase/UDP-glucose 4-epimerase
MNLNSELAVSELIDSYWLKMRDESIFMTGGSGLFGRWFINALLAANQRLGTNIKVTILTRDPQALLIKIPEIFLDSAIILIKGDITNFEFPTSKFSRIIHLATTSAEETFNGEDQLAKFHLLTKGTERVLQFASTCGAKKILFTSSGVAYGAYSGDIQFVPETYFGAPDTTDPTSALGQGKRAAEFLCGYYADKYNFNLVIARCFSFVGPELPLGIHYAIGNFIKDALESDALYVKGDGTQMRSYLYLGDLVTWLLVLLVDGKSGRIYNVGSDKAISILELAHRVRDLLAPEKQVIVTGNKSHNIGNFDRKWYVPEISRARKELNLDDWTPLDCAILNTAEHHKKSYHEN